MPHACSYLPGRTATTLFIDPQQRVGVGLFSELTQHGFRRSGDFVYRPHCQDCAACVPVRIGVNRFEPNRSQRRTWRLNRDVSVQRMAPIYKHEHFALYLSYQRARHPGGGMDEPDPEKYMRFLSTRHVQSYFYEMRLGRRLIAVAVADVLPDGLSAVYTFYEPDEGRRGLGVYAIMVEIEEARSQGLPWLYLGYWIEQSPKMNYKRNFKPLEAYANGQWTPLTTEHVPAG